MAASPDSPYADQLVYQVAQCERQQGHLTQAAAALQSLVTDYPGSHLADQAKEELQDLRQPLEAGNPASDNSPD